MRSETGTAEKGRETEIIVGQGHREGLPEGQEINLGQGKSLLKKKKKLHF